MMTSQLRGKTIPTFGSVISSKKKHVNVDTSENKTRSETMYVVTTSDFNKVAKND